MFESGDTVRVVDAPGYEDFTGTLLMHWTDWPQCVVQCEGDGSEECDDFHVVPFACLKEYVA